MCLEGCSPVEVLEAKLAVTLYTSSTQNMSCGTNQSSKGTVLFLGLGRCAISYPILSQAFPAFGQNQLFTMHNWVFHASQYFIYDIYKQALLHPTA